MPTPKNVQEAKDWCEIARKLVNKRSGKAKDLKEARDQVTNAVESLVDQLDILRGLNASEGSKFDVRFVEIGKTIKGTGSKGGDDKKFIEAGTALKQLGEEVQKAITLEQELAKAVKAFNEDHDKLYIEVAEASGLRGMEDDNSTVYAQWQDLKQSLIDYKTAVDKTRDKTVVQTQWGLLTGIRTKLLDVKSESVKLDKAAEGQIKAMKTWKDLEPKVRAALKELGEKPGAQTERTQLLEMYTEARKLIVSNGPSTTGHADAVNKVQGYDKLLISGKTAIANLANQGLPTDVVKAKNAVTVVLFKYEDLVSKHVYKVDEAERDRLAELGKSDQLAAVEALGKLRDALTRETDRLGKEKSAADTAQQKYTEALDKVKKITTPSAVPLALYQALEDQGALTANDLQPATGTRQWPNAEKTFSALAIQLNTLEQDYTRHGAAWAKAQTDLEAWEQTALSFLKLLAGTKLANECLGQIKLLREAFANQDMGEALKEFAQAQQSLSTKLDTLKDLLPDVPDKDKLSPDERIANHVKVLNTEGAELLNAITKYQGEVRTFLDDKEFAKVKKGGKPPLTSDDRQWLQTHYSGQLDEIWNEWCLYRNGSAKAELPDAVKVKVNKLSARAKNVYAELEQLPDLKQKAQSVAQDTPKVSAKSELDAYLLAPPPGMSKHIEDVQSTTLTDEEKLKELKRRHLDLRKTVASSRKGLLEKMKSDITEPLKKLNISATYRKELEESGRDIQRMADSDDPDLLQIATEMQAKMKDQLGKIAQQPDLYQNNKKELEKLAKRIGTLLPELSDSHARMFSQWEDEVAQSKHTDPMAMKTRVDEFTKQVVSAENALEKRLAAVTEYRKKKTEVRTLWDKVKKVGNAPALAPWFDARLADAHQVRLTELGVPAAEQILAQVKKELDLVLNSNPPALALAELNAKQVLAQRHVLDLAKQFERELKIFYSVTLDQAKVAVKKSKNGDKDTANGLEDMGKAAEKVVSPYMKNLTLLKIGAAPAPERNKVDADFERARQLLRDASATAQRLVGAPQTTNVDGPEMGAKVREGLAKVQGKWFERVRAFDSALGEVAKKVGEMKSKFDNASDEITNYLKEKYNDGTVGKTSAASAVKGIEDLRTLFRTDMFAGSFQVLMEASALTKDAKKLQKAKQVVAREDALRVMRQCRDRLQHPLLKTLIKPESSRQLGGSLLLAVSALNTVLKEIELQALASA